MIARTEAQLVRIAETYWQAAKEFAQTHADRMAEQRAEQMAALAQAQQSDGVDRTEMASRLSDEQATGLPARLGVDFASVLMDRISTVRAELLLAQEHAAVLSSNSLGPARRAIGAGRTTQFETELWKVLRDAGFSCREIGEELVRPRHATKDTAGHVEERLRKNRSK